MNFYNAPRWLRFIYPGGLIWQMDVQQKVVYLTFDDGPIPEVTPLVLEILNKYNVKATFFMVGDNVQKYPHIFESVKQHGHAVGNHTYHHLKAWSTSHSAYLSDVEKCHEIILTNLFRPPHGQINRLIAKKLKTDYKIVMWSTLTGDYNNKLDGRQCLANAVKGTFPGAIIVFHDSIKALPRMEYTLPLYIEYCRQNGYSFSTLAALNY